MDYVWIPVNKSRVVHRKRKRPHPSKVEQRRFIPPLRGKKAVAKIFFTKKRRFQKNIYPQQKVETGCPPLVQILYYYLFINYLQTIFLCIKTQQHPEVGISKFLPVFFPTRSPGIFLFLYFFIFYKTQKKKDKKEVENFYAVPSFPLYCFFSLFFHVT